MKHQISKVALAATLAFIGFGFTGTQQAKASDCSNQNCNSSCAACDGILTNPRIEEYTTTSAVCVNCDGHCPSHFYKVHVVKHYCDAITSEKVVPDPNPCQTKQPVGKSTGNC